MLIDKELHFQIKHIKCQGRFSEGATMVHGQASLNISKINIKCTDFRGGSNLVIVFYLVSKISKNI